MTVDDPKLLEGVLHENDLFLDHERQITLIDASNIISMEILLEIAETPTTLRAPNQPT